MRGSVSRHRRPRRAVWIAGTAGLLGLALIAAVGAATVLRTAGDECDQPPVALTVAASPDQAPVLDELAQQWNADRAETSGAGCAEVQVVELAGSEAAGRLSPSWDEDADGPRPDVWIPDSSLWLMVAAGRPDAAGLLPAGPPPSLASSPVVLAMQQPMAEALGWPDQELGWADLLGAFAGGQSWEQFGHPEWGPLRLGIADPTRSTSGMAAVLTVLDLDGDNELSDEELLAGIGFSQLVTVEADSTEQLLDSFADGSAEDPELPAAFPVLERDLAGYAAAGPAVPLVPVYPREGVVFADYPYAVLRASWVDEPRRQLAADFLAYLQSPAGQEAFQAAGYRDVAASGGGTAGLVADRGFVSQLEVPARVPAPEALGELAGMWPVLVRPNNLLIVLDTSGSMNNPVPGTEFTRLELLQGAALEGITLLNNQTTVGLWEFSTELTPTTPYRELVPSGPAGEQLDEFGGVDRRQAMAGAILGLTAQGGTGLYDTIHDSYLYMQSVWQPEAQNLLVIITDGRDEDHIGRSRDELLEALAEAVQPDRPLAVLALAVGPEADVESLEQVTAITGGRTVVARDDVSAIQEVILVFAGRGA